MKEEGKKSFDTLDLLFEGPLKPLHSKNARYIFKVFMDNKRYQHLTTHDIEKVLEERGLVINKKEINAWLVSLQNAKLIIKMNERGKPIVSRYEDRYTFDLWCLSETGLNVGQNLSIFIDNKLPKNIPKLADLTPEIIHEIEDLYFTSKILLILYNYGGVLTYSELRKHLAVDREKLAIYSWPDVSHSEKPLFEITIKPPTLRTKIFKIFGWVFEQDLTFKLTDEGQNIANIISSRKNSS